jgi:hypothetical protein
MRVGRQANSTIGRFMRLYLRNILGYRIPPGAGDKGSIGQSFLVALAEDEDSAERIGWRTFAEDHGFKRGENVVTVQSVVCISPPTYSAGAHAEEHVAHWAEVFGHTCAYWSHTGFKMGLWHLTIVAGANVAEVIAREWSKDRVRHYLYNHMKVSADRVLHYAKMTATPTFDFRRLVDQGVLPPEYAASDDPQRRVPLVVDPAMINIVVAGDPERNQSRAYMANHRQGPPTSRRVELPRAWDELRARKS